MSDLDDRIREAMERSTAPADPAGAFERVVRKRARRRTVRRAQTVGLTVAVVVVTSGVTFTLGRMFGSDRPHEAAQTPTPSIQSFQAFAFASDREGDLDIYVASADGRDVRRVTDDPDDDLGPAWSPDGTRIAFTRGLEDDPNIFVMNSDGTGVVQLTDHPADDVDPAWSPDGTSIAFVSTREGGTDLYLMDADGSSQRPLTRDAASDFDPAWSPDGTQLFFSRDEIDGIEESDIWVIDVRNGEGRKVIGGSSADYQPAPSPDGSKIAFVSNRDGTGQIYVARADGSNVRQITETLANKSRPSWSPDGRQIAFSAGDEMNREVFVVDADGSNLRRIIDDPGNEVTPEWNPSAPAPTEPDGGSEGETRCLSEAEAAADPSLRKPGSLRGDVDGDGVADEVSVAIDPQTEEPTCGYFLVVESDAAARATRIDLTYVEGTSDELVGVQSLAEISGQGGLEVLVHLQRGVMEWGALYTMSDGILTPIVAIDPDDAEIGVFSYGRTPTQASGLDCTGKAGIIVVSGAHADGDGWVVDRLYYRLEGSELRIYPQSERHRLSDQELEASPLEERFPEFGEAPLDDCPGFVSAS